MNLTIRGNTILGVGTDDESIAHLVAMGFAEDEIRAAIDQHKRDALRVERNRRIALCDWTQLPDAPLAGEQKAAWATYRQALRDLPESAADLDNVVWPVQPA